MNSCSANGLNLYCYCNNDSVNFIDPSGYWIDTVLDVLSAGVSAVEVIFNPLDPWAWAGLVGDIVDIAIPFVSGLGETVKGAKVVKYIGNVDDIVDSSYDTIKFVKATDMVGDFSDGGMDMIRTLNRTSDGFTISTRTMGTQIHKAFMGNGYRIPGTRLRVDGWVEDSMKLYELKPYNKLSARRAVGQILNYNNVLGGGCKMFIVLY